MYVFTRFTFSFCCVQTPIKLVVFPVKNNWSPKIAYKSLISQFWIQSFCQYKKQW